VVGHHSLQLVSVGHGSILIGTGTQGQRDTHGAWQTPQDGQRQPTRLGVARGATKPRQTYVVKTLPQFAHFAGFQLCMFISA
jgi:hypothetical protein